MEGAQKGAGKLDLRSRYFSAPQQKDWKSFCAPQNRSEIRILRSWSAILPTIVFMCVFFYFIKLDCINKQLLDQFVYLFIDYDKYVKQRR